MARNPAATRIVQILGIRIVFGESNNNAKCIYGFSLTSVLR
jgi:hypothetical protein